MVHRKRVWKRYWETSNKVRVFISGPSGAGKSTIIRKLLALDDKLVLSVSYTTRGPRPEEVHGKDYFFVSREEFEDMIKKGAFLEYANVHGHLYGTSLDWVRQKEESGLDVLFDIDVQGVEQVKAKAPQGCFIFIVPPGMDTLKERLGSRGTETPESMKLRLRNAIKELAYWKNYDYLVVNDDLDRAVREVSSIITAFRCKAENAIKALGWLQEIG